MPYLKSSRKKIIIIISILLAIFIINSLVSNIIHNKISETLLKNESKYYTIQVESSNFSLLRRSLVLNNVSLIPKQAAIDSLIKNQSKKQALETITLSSIKFKGIGLINVLFNHKINLKTLEVNDLYVINLKNKEIEGPKNKAKGINLDSIYIKKLNGFRIDKIDVNNFVYEVVDAKTNEISFKNAPLSFVSSGFKLVEVEENVFKLLPVNESFDISNIDLHMNTIKYDFSIDNLAFNFRKDLVSIKNLKFKPQISRQELSKTYRYSKDVFDVEIEELKAHNFNLKKLLNKEGLIIDSITVSGLNMALYKDKRLPFNTNAYIKLPHIALQQSETPINISKVIINNSAVLIEEQLATHDTVMSVSFNNVAATIQNITSIDTLRKKPMFVDLNALIMKKAPLEFHANFPLNSQTFNFNGNLGRAELKLFDSALFPVLGLKILGGNIDSMNFSVEANNTISNGSITMLYHGLKAKVFKANSLQKNKFLSWSLNTIIKKSNPNKKNKVRVATIKFEREKSKGLGNYIWKSLLSGIANSIAPGGKQVKN